MGRLPPVMLHLCFSAPEQTWMQVYFIPPNSYIFQETGIMNDRRRSFTFRLSTFFFFADFEIYIQQGNSKRVIKGLDYRIIVIFYRRSLESAA